LTSGVAAFQLIANGGTSKTVLPAECSVNVIFAWLFRPSNRNSFNGAQSARLELLVTV